MGKLVLGIFVTGVVSVGEISGWGSCSWGKRLGKTFKINPICLTRACTRGVYSR